MPVAASAILFGCDGSRTTTPTSPTLTDGPVSVAPANGFTLSGTVYESRAGEPPLLGVLVQVIDGTNRRFVLTNAAGWYSLSGLVDSVTVHVSKSGYESKEQKLSVRQDVVLNFSLAQTQDPE